MNADTWGEAAALFHQALEQPPAGREAFLDAACRERAGLRREVASLLAAHERSAGFLDQPPAVAATLTGIFDAPVSLLGQQLGPYRILHVLGVGGMGVVYAAEDTRLGRRVALKALPGRFTMDEARRARLRREARAAAGLNHPGIATVYALEEFDGRLYIAGEYLTGETLREEGRRGPLPLPRLVETAAAIAAALDAAHTAGLVHRDLKPENVMRVDHDDAIPAAVKLLDFGLAQARDAATGADAKGDGALLGTPGYMSPEQLLGQPVDARSDHFALGVLLHELATGRHPFATGDPATTIARVLTAEPEPLAGRPPFESGTGAAFASVVERCLRKDASARFPTTRDLVSALRALHTGATLTDVIPPPVAPAPIAKAVFWWQFHQLASSLFASALVVLLWFTARTIPTAGRAAFAAGLVAAIVAVTMRLHNWFTRRAFPGLWTAQFHRTRRWVRWGDRIEAAVLIACGLAALWESAGLGAGAVGGGVLLLLASDVIEPVTTSAAAG